MTLRTLGPKTVSTESLLALIKGSRNAAQGKGYILARRAGGNYVMRWLILLIDTGLINSSEGVGIRLSRQRAWTELGYDGPASYLKNVQALNLQASVLII